MHRGRGLRLSVLHRKCQDCRKSIIVPRITPCQEPSRITGIWIYSYDNDADFVPAYFLCWDCASKRCDEGKISLGFVGGYLNDLSRWEGIIEIPDRRVKEIVKSGINGILRERKLRTQNRVSRVRE